MNPEVLVVIAIVVVAGLIVRKRSKSSEAARQRYPLEGDPAGAEWQITWSPGMPRVPVRNAAGWVFDFPSRPDHHVHCVQWYRPPALAPGDDWQATATTEQYRYFSKHMQPLVAGEFEIRIPLHVADWGGVFGGQDATMFAAALRELESIGIAFGSGGGRAHGVYATQPSRFELLGVDVAEH